MQYAMLVYFDETEFLALPAPEQDRLRNECADWHEALLKQGKRAGTSRLQPVSTATTLRKKNGKLSVFDGPFAETKEILGGFVLLECGNLDEAVALARDFPALPAGFTLEIRPAMPDGTRRNDAPTRHHLSE
jgi:hypothetical protein